MYKLLEQKLAESERRYRNIFTTMPIALLEQDFGAVGELIAALKSRGMGDLRAHLAEHPEATREAMGAVRITEANDAALQLFEAQDKSALLGSLEKLFLPETEAAFRDELVALFEGAGQFASETVLQTLTGRRLDVMLIMTLPPDAARQVAVVSVIDISERKRAEAEHAAVLAREHHARRQAEQANRSKDEFLATVSHELRTPLNAILGWTQTLQQGETRPDLVRRGLAAIERAARAQAELVDDLLHMADIVSGRLRLNIQDMRLIPAITAAVESLRPAMEAKDIRFEAQLDPGGNRLYGDPGRLQQVVWNLLSNAVKFTPAGGRIRLTLARHPDAVEITVQDNGQGIKPQFLPYLFERFHQADASSRKRHGGLGLGLAIVRHLVELHGGTVEAESKGEGRGATFRVRLPLRAALRPDDPALPHGAIGAEARSAVAGPPRLDGLRVLFVDDDPNTREMLQEALTRGGAQVEAAASAGEAVDKLRQWLPDVVVSDIGMPDEDGYDLMRRVRALPPEQGGRTPAVALTGYARERDRTLALDAGYQAFTPKPVDLNELFAIIARVVPRGRQGGA